MTRDPKTHAVMGIDPGGTTGIFAGYVEIGSTMAETMETLHNQKAVEIEGDWLEQSGEIASIMKRFTFTANVENYIPIGNIHFAIEDFVLRRREEGGATGNLTSCWVAAGAVALYGSIYDRQTEDVYPRVGLGNPSITWRQASTAKSYAKDDRIRRWGLWQKGSAHTRDAGRHFAAEVNDLVP